MRAASGISSSEELIFNWKRVTRCEKTKMRKEVGNAGVIVSDFCIMEWEI